ncbi:betaine--homocysteine S-methyltransferase [Roseobacter sp. EG26]|uniref:betaine--homocysteine S-methyltransferase n=1 Tax=Roseobacter sp. EG26 TaxID=3412477 RepID=UPI003CE498CA
MTNPFLKLLGEKGTLLADGATGTNLFNMGLMSGDAPELWNTDEPQKIKSLYKGAVDAGSDLFLTNSFGANASRLKLHGAEKRVHELARVSAEIGREVADTAGRDVIVAGSVGPTGEIMEPVGTLSHSLAVEIFHEAADGLKAGGADIGWLETISAPEEYRAAAEGFMLAGLTWAGTMSFDTAGRTMMGLTSADMVKMVDDLDAAQAPVAFGANCGTGASDLLRTILGFSAQGSEKPIIAKGNAGIPKYVDGHIHYDGTPELMADYAVMARACGAHIIGGCCGTMPEHLRHMREALDTRTMAHPPALEEIVDRLGAFSSQHDGTGENATPARRTSRRRRAAG